MALTHNRLLEEWRERALSGQVEARRVMAEMLTPSGMTILLLELEKVPRNIEYYFPHHRFLFYHIKCLP